jgi:hypothetical protein
MSLTLKVIEIDKLEIGNTILIGKRIYHVLDIVEKDSFGYRLKLQDLNGELRFYFANLYETVTIEL